MRLTMPGRALARSAAVLALALTMATGTTGLLSGPQAHAQPVTDGSLAFSGDEGDWISGGGSYAYSTDSQDKVSVTGSSDNRVISLSVDGANGDWWYLDLAAPEGTTLAPGTYAGATRYPFNEATEPGLSLGGNGRGCNTLTGSFTITAVEFGPQGYVKELVASFEQHCEGATPPRAARWTSTTRPRPPSSVSVSPWRSTARRAP